MATGILISTFAVSFAVPQFNSIIGLNQLCDQAKKAAAEKGGVHYYYCEMSRADNLDVYLGTKPEKLKVSDLYNSKMIKTPAILFTFDKAIERHDSIQAFIKDKKSYRTGSYYCFEIEK